MRSRTSIYNQLTENENLEVHWKNNMFIFRYNSVELKNKLIENDFVERIRIKISEFNLLELKYIFIMFKTVNKRLE